MRRRDFMAMLGGAALVWPREAYADKVRTIGILMQGSETNPRTARMFEVLQRSLTDLGWREGVNSKIELRWAQNDAERRAYARELVSLKPDVIVAPSTSLTPVREATQSIPIIFLLIADPVSQGIVSSLAHPGGNLTGLAYMEFSIGGKLVQLLKEIAPETKRVLVLLDGDSTTSTSQWWHSIEGAARVLDIEPQQALARTDDEIDAAVHTFAQAQEGGVVVPPQSFMVTHAARLTAAVAHERLPAVYGATPIATAGGLVSYSADAVDQFKRAASYVDRILKGEKPGDLPIEEPTKFELIVNLKTSKALRIEIPSSILAQADEVIE
jgi:putative ABC transport system substrate-binding protein